MRLPLPFSVPFIAGLLELTRMRYVLPMIALVGMVIGIVPDVVPDNEPIVVPGKFPEGSESSAVKTFPALNGPHVTTNVIADD